VEYISFSERIQRQFDAFCRKVLRYAARNFYSRIARQAEHELSLSEFSEDRTNITAVFDEYFEGEQQFSALGFSVTIKSELLSEALQLLSARQQDIIMRYYFLGMNDREISEADNGNRGTISYQRNAALRKLKKILEGLEHEKQL
jgi:RNA polymerase sigma factor (sigma-70 family)